jgi:hypothetical protein
MSSQQQPGTNLLANKPQEEIQTNLPINKESPNKDLNLEDIDEDEVTQLCDDELDE